MNKIKIAKYLSECGISSRRNSEELVKKGLVFINGKKETNVAQRIDPEKDIVKFDNKIIKPKNYVYYLLYKPVGYVSTTTKKFSKKIVTDLVPQKPKVWPVGRLDKNTSGLIILTNNGELTQKITHPKYQKEKEYSIITNLALNNNDIEKIKKGVFLEDGLAKPRVFEEIENKNYRMILTEGRKRIVRRVIEKVGKKVSQLKRVRLDKLTLDDLKIGQWRKLSNSEVKEFIN